MFRFFRSIRLQLLSENKTVKYLKYAVGEVLLVVVGILIALSVNNWNEERKLELDRLELIENLKRDYEASLKQLEEFVPNFESRTNSPSSTSSTPSFRIGELVVVEQR